jgi:hypothetical protein
MREIVISDRHTSANGVLLLAKVTRDNLEQAAFQNILPLAWH